MPKGRRRSTSDPPTEDIVQLHQALTRMGYLLTRHRWHDKVRMAAGVDLDRAASAVLGQLTELGATRPGELASRMQVEAPHVSRQVQGLEDAGYVERVPDPGDGRAHLVTVTPKGRDAADRLREVVERMMQDALAQWTQRDVHQLATLLSRMVGDFVDEAS